MNIASLLILASLAAGGANAPKTALVETEYFEDLGGWTSEAQFFEQVGSQYIFAHGLGIPVADAVTTVKLPAKGQYNIWVRTYNWNAPWDPSKAPGVFQLLINGKVVADKLGDEPVKWDWQKAGSFSYDGKPFKLALHDLTGFDGRCDAVFFTTSDKPEFPTERLTKPEVSKAEYDLIVVGAGPGGLGAAVGSARLGKKTLLLESRDVVGGNSAPGIAVGVSGYVKMAPYENIGNVISEYGNVFKRYETVMNYLSTESNLTLMTGCRVIGAEMKDGAIKSITALDTRTGKQTVYKAKFYADCTGDGNLGALAGAEYMQGAETRDVYGEDLAPEKPVLRSYGSTIKWVAHSLDHPTTFPETPWAPQFNEKTRMKVMHSSWNFEAGFQLDHVKDAERIRDHLFRVTYGNWSYLKNSKETSEEYANASLKSVGVILGKRESRRLKGDYVLTQNDIEGDWQNHFDDGVVWCTYPIDQHFPMPRNSEDFPGQEFLSTMKHNHNPLGISRRFLKQGVDFNEPYMVPYRCLYSKNVSNMFMAGRDISVSRIALCSTRIEGGISMMGEVVAVAASLCTKFNCTPREIYTKHLKELKDALKVGIPSKYEAVYKMN